MNDVDQVTMTLPPDVSAALTAFAAEKRLTEGEAGARIVTEFLAREAHMSAHNAARNMAELQLHDIADAIIDRIAADDNWGEDVTADIFSEIEKQHLPTYEKAVDGDPYGGQNHHKARINKRIGARVRSRLNADVRVVNGHRLKGQYAIGSRLISSWTKLYRPETSSQEA